MKKTNKPKKIKISVLALAVSGLFTGSVYAAGSYCEYDFSDGIFEWTPLYDNADYAFETEEDGNQYLRLEYNGNENRGHKYYDVKAADLRPAQGEQLEVNYDIKYEEVETAERNSEMHIKNRTGPGSTQTQMVGRLCKSSDKLMVKTSAGGFDYIRDLTGAVFSVEVDRWYSVKFIVDLEKHVQSCYIYDRDTKELLARKIFYDTETDTNVMNMVTFSGSTAMCLDNVRIFSTAYSAPFISGEADAKAGTEAVYELVSENAYGDFINLSDTYDVSWSLNTSVPGVSLTNNMLYISDPVEPGIAILKAEYTDEKAEIHVLEYAVIMEAVEAKEKTETGNILTFRTEAGKLYYVNVQASNAQRLDDCIYTLEYTPKAFSLYDACAATTDWDRTANRRTKTAVSVGDITDNSVSFTTKEQVPEGMLVSGTVNTVILKAEYDGIFRVEYSMIKN